jgi:hypothetical protein
MGDVTPFPRAGSDHSRHAGGLCRGRPVFRGRRESPEGDRPGHTAEKSDAGNGNQGQTPSLRSQDPVSESAGDTLLNPASTLIHLCLREALIDEAPWIAARTAHGLATAHTGKRYAPYLCFRDEMAALFARTWGGPARRYAALPSSEDEESVRQLEGGALDC